MKAEGKKILPPLSVDLFQSWDFGRTCQFWLDLLLLNPLIQPQLQAFGLGSSVDSGEAKDDQIPYGGKFASQVSMITKHLDLTRRKFLSVDSHSLFLFDTSSMSSHDLNLATDNSQRDSLCQNDRLRESSISVKAT